jgi:hypothetical protein
MRKSRFSDEQIIAILKEGESGVPAADLARRHGVSQNPSTTGGRSTAASRSPRLDG